MNGQRARSWDMRKMCWCVGMVGVLVSTAGRIAHAQNVAAARGADEHARTLQELLARRVTVTISDLSLARAIDSVARVANTEVQFRLPVLSAYPKPVSLSVVNVPLGIALERLLDKTSLQVVLDHQGHLLVTSTGNAENADSTQGVVTGRVVDSATAQGVRGAVVQVVGTKLSVLTVDGGQFTLRNVPPGDHVLAVKLFGYRPAEQSVTVSADQHVSVHIALAGAPNVLSGVVTTAVGQQRKLEVGNDITTLNADSILRVAPVTTVTQLLENRVPGLVVQNTTGIPGAPSRLRLRGASSIMMSDDPIVVVDGVRVYADQSGTPGNVFLPGTVASGGGSSVTSPRATYAGPSALDQIDVNSIETIEVLKGPSASALYGSDAANGVIVITTKKGRAGPTRWTASIDQGWTTLPGNWPDNYYRFGSPFDGGASRICDISIADPGQCTLDSLVRFQALNNPTSSPFGTGITQGASSTVSGGSGSMTYSLTGSAENQTGYLHLPDVIAQQFEVTHGFPAPQWMTNPDHYTTWGGTGVVGMQLGQQGANLQFMHSMLQSRQQQSSLQGQIGTLGSTYFNPVQLSTAGFVSGFYERAVLQTETMTDVLALNNWAPLWGLPIRATVGLNSSSSDNNTVTPRNYVIGTADSVGLYGLNHGNNKTGSFDAGTSVRQRFVTTAMGLQATLNSTNGFSANTTDLPPGVMTPTTFNCVAPATLAVCTLGNQADFHTTTYGWYVQPTLNLNSRFFVSPGIRFDGGNASGSGNTFNPFPKLDFSYIAVDQDHPRFNVVTLVRPRLAFGIAGVQPGPAQSLRLYNNPNTVTFATDSGTVASSTTMLQLSGLGNTKLHPERSRELEGGVDLGFGNDRVSLTVSGYHKTRYDAIMSVPVAPSVTGGSQFTNIAVNVGTIQNTGVEATLGARLLDTRSVSWSVNGNFSTDHNRVVSLDPGLQNVISSTYSGAGSLSSVIRPGYPINGYWTKPIIGYADENQDGFIQVSEIRLADSAAYVGDALPKYQLNANTTLSLFNGRVTVNTAVSYDNGLTQLNGSANLLTQIYNDPQSTLSQQASTVTYPITFHASNIGSVQTVSTLRWSSLSVSWITPQTIAHWVRSSQVALTLQGSNLGLHSNYTGKDPNVNAFSSGNLTADDGQLPQPRTWSVRVDLR